MKTKTFLLSAAFILAASTSLTSCIDDEESTSIGTIYCTISGSMDAGYTLYADDGSVIHPNTTNIFELYGAKGFDGLRRGHIQFIYEHGNCKQVDDKYIITNAKILNTAPIITKAPLTREAADLAGITSADSTWTLSSIGDLWLVNGYLNITWKSAYAVGDSTVGILPTVNLVYNRNEIKDDEIFFQMYCNRHAQSGKKDSIGSVIRVDSFDMGAIIDSIPGADSIKVSILTPKGDTISSKTDRKWYVYPDSK